MINKRESFFTKIIYSQKFLALIGFGLVVFISFPLAKNVSKRYHLNKEIRELDKEITEFESKNKDLKGLITYLESEQFVEEKARLNLGLKKEGEKVVEIKDDVFATTTASLPAGSQSNPGIIFNLRRWWNYFFNKKLP
ncbi:MAG: septum formation initiator family protein [Patescibacteria group bacterium]|nr:septum formation initiator family protein [Patescibacteria group bacterium]MDD5294941.1 septum formation initiator family protein [Patescibacteria group bacterium]MDD5554747.1 septum formation initiator family protein [Patescibacteria group bacterium]